MMMIKHMEYHKIQIQIILLLFFQMDIIVKNVVKSIVINIMQVTSGINNVK
jgi:hypothetical protein